VASGRCAAAAAAVVAVASADERDQRHALRRRDAGAPDHLHGRGAAADRRRANRPPGNTAKALEGATEPITISIAADGRIFMQETEVRRRSRSRRSRRSRRTAMTNGSTCAAIENADYGTMMKLMGRINAAGYKRLGLVTLEERDS
jgi:biopolymer transport protein ExbD